MSWRAKSRVKISGHNSKRSAAHLVYSVSTRTYWHALVHIVARGLAYLLGCPREERFCHRFLLYHIFFGRLRPQNGYKFNLLARSLVQKRSKWHNSFNRLISHVALHLCFDWRVLTVLSVLDESWWFKGYDHLILLVLCFMFGSACTCCPFLVFCKYPFFVFIYYLFHVCIFLLLFFSIYSVSETKWGWRVMRALRIAHLSLGIAYVPRLGFLVRTLSIMTRRATTPASVLLVWALFMAVLGTQVRPGSLQHRGRSHSWYTGVTLVAGTALISTV